MLSSQLEPTWTLILVSSLLLARGIASLGALTALAACNIAGSLSCTRSAPKPYPLWIDSPVSVQPRLDRNSSDTVLAFIFLHSSRVYMSICPVTGYSPTRLHWFRCRLMWHPQLRPLRPGASLAGTLTHLSMTVFVAWADVGSMSRLHPSALSNLLRSSCSNI